MYEQIIPPLVHDVQLVERLMIATRDLGRIAPALSAVVDFDAEVAPEMKVALEHVREAMLAIERSIEFVGARMEVRHEKLG